MFDEIDHSAILDAVWWALNNVAKWRKSRMRRVDRFSVAKQGKAVQLGCDCTEGEMVTNTVSQVMQVCKFDLAHSYVNVRHRLYKRGLVMSSYGWSAQCLLCYHLLQKNRSDSIHT